ncbi:[acyl-carrier-protein] S-malonyltransferase [Savitreella phatthalungensis]
MLKRGLATGASATRTAVFFPGQGSQQVGMLKPWLERWACARELAQELDDAIGFPLTRLIDQGPPSELNFTENAQPAILLQSSIIVRVLKDEFGIDLASVADYTLGHSLGEFTALALSGIVTPAASLKLVRERGLAMRQAAEMSQEAQAGRSASMIALVVERGRSRFVVEQLARFRRERRLDLPQNKGEVLCVANHNSDSQVVVAGYDDLLRDFIGSLKRFDGRDPRAIKLPLSAPFHTPIMAPAQTRIMTYLRDHVDFTIPAKVPLISNVSALPMPDGAESARHAAPKSPAGESDADACKRLIARGCTETVRWLDSVEWLRDEAGVGRYISIGPSQVARKLVEAIVAKERVLHVGRVEDCEPLAKALL